MTTFQFWLTPVLVIGLRFYNGGKFLWKTFQIENLNERAGIWQMVEMPLQVPASQDWRS